MAIKFSVQTEPVPFKRAMTNGKRRFNDPRYTDFKNVVGLHAKVAMQGRAPFTEPIKITVNTFTKYKPTALQSGDVDNHLKAVMDALNGICFFEDRQIVEGHVYLHKCTTHVEIELEELKC
ncbi:MAG: RusA family crossover junction endodeoxyribonuclease [Selenomonadaceae bacterium]|nr:RusA family crossover junction endodeoxyribonuclease [Selenomonadaceae bacterium]